jgi:hypothetical protein
VIELRLHRHLATLTDRECFLEAIDQQFEAHDARIDGRGLGRLCHGFPAWPSGGETTLRQRTQIVDPRRIRVQGCKLIGVT